MEKTRIGFVGVGGMGQCAHLRNYVTLPDCEVVAIAELREGLGKRVAERYGVQRVYSSHEAMFAAEKLDGIVASQPFTRHGVLVPELLKAGIPVFTEKPLAGSIDAGQRVLDALAGSNTWHMVGYHKRSDPATMYAHDLIREWKASGEFGKLKYVRVVMPAGDWIANGFLDLIGSSEAMPPIEWDAPAADMDARVYEQYIAFVNYYIHQVNLLRHLLCEPYTVTYGDPNGVLLVAETAGGATGLIEMSPYTTTIDWQESALIAFEHAWIKIELPAPVASNRPGRVEVYRDGGGVPALTTPTLPWVHAMRQQAANFVAAVRGEREPMCQAAEAMDDLKVAREYIRKITGA